ncbi:MAG: hypothetical protein ABF289_04380, partial [Clostridiales bacterium]
AYVDYIYKVGGKDELIRFFNNESSVFKYNVIIKLSEENENISNYEEDIVIYLEKLTKYKYYYGDLVYNKGNLLVKTLEAALKLKNKKIDEFILLLTSDKSKFFGKMDLIKNIKKIDCSEYLKPLVKLVSEDNIDEDYGKIELKLLSNPNSYENLNNACHKSKIVSIQNSKIYNNKYSVADDGSVIMWNKEDLGFVIRLYSIYVKKMCISESSRYFLFLSENMYILTDVFTGKDKEILIDEGIFYINFYKESVLCITKNWNIKIDGKLIDVDLELDKDEIVSMISIKNKIIVLDKNNFINIFDIDRDFVNISVQYVRIDKNKNVKICRNNDEEIYIINEEKIIIYNINDMKLDKEIYTQSSINNFIVSKDRKYYLQIHNNTIEFYKSENYDLIARKSFEKKVSSILNNDTNNFYVALENGMLYHLKL